MKSLQEQIKFTDTCWIWTGTTDSCGYGRIKRNKKTVSIHRYIFSLLRGPIPKGKQVLHSCDNPPCVNPEHLWIGTHKDNMKDMVSKNRHYQKNKTRCKRGHILSEQNTLTYKTKTGICRSCRTCKHNLYTGDFTNDKVPALRNKRSPNRLQR